MTICLIDTSVFCELLEVPRLTSQPRQLAESLKKKLDADEALYLPLVTVLETGNHVGQNGDGRQRRATAERFVKRVQQALAGESPFFFVNLHNEKLAATLGDFPDWASRRSGLGDLTIKKAWEDLAERHPLRRVYVWSLDNHLSGFDTGER